MSFFAAAVNSLVIKSKWTFLSCMDIDKYTLIYSTRIAQNNLVSIALCLCVNSAAKPLRVRLVSEVAADGSAGRGQAETIFCKCVY